MKSWQIIAVNAFATFLAVVAVLKFFPPDTPQNDTGEIRQTLDTQMKGIEARLSAIEDTLRKQLPAVGSSSEVPGSHLEKLARLDQKLGVIVGKLSALENEIVNVQPARAPRPPVISDRFPTSAPAKRQNPMAWLDDLPGEKRREVDLIFEEHARRIRERLPVEPDGTLPNRETMRKVMKESDWELKEDLKAVLTDEEYQRFLDSHPKLRSRGLALPGGRPEPLR